MEQTNLAYLAGLFDGEGTFSIQVKLRSAKGRKSVHFNPRMTMTLKYGTHELTELQSVFGGQVYQYKNGCARWNLSKREALISATAALLPFLRIKKHIGVRFLEALGIFPASRKDHLKGQRSWTPEMVQKVAHIALTLNPYRKSKQEPEWAYLAAEEVKE